MPNARICTKGLQILRYSEAGKLSDFLDVAVRETEFSMVTRIGLTRDADQSYDTAAQSLRGVWERTSRTIRDIHPDMPIPACHLFVLPDNHSPGRLEDLCLQAPTFAAVLACAFQMHECATRVATFPIDREKSLVAAYLSMMRTPGLHLGAAALAGSWDLLHAAFHPLHEFVRAVAG